MNKNGTGIQDVTAKLERILRRRGLPDFNDFTQNMKEAVELLQNEASRPAARNGLPGGLIRLSAGGYFVIIPDLHARMDFFLEVMKWSGFSGRSVLSDMIDGAAQVICVGDAFHSEARGRERWNSALAEWLGGYKKHKNIDQEMIENLGLLEMIITVKAACPDRFHFLKGNHENIANESKEGNFAFRKFANEGEMVSHWVGMFMGEDTFKTIYTWEKSLPLVAEGPDFLVCHAEPGRAIRQDDVINAFENPDIISRLTWTRNDQAEKGSVAASLKNFGMTSPESRIFGGHRVVTTGLYSERQKGRYIQINRPDCWVIAAFTDMQVFKADRDIIRIDQGE